MQVIHRRGGAGIFLLLLLLGVGLALWLYFGNTGGGSYAQKVVETKKQGEQLNMTLSTRQLGLLIAQYREANGKLPATIEDLEIAPGTFTDAWDNPVTFKVKSDKGGPDTVIEYRSAGPDKEEGTEDDIVQEEGLPY